MVPNRAKHYAGSSCIVDDDTGGVLYLLQKEHKKRITTWYNLAVILLTLQNSPRRNCMPEHFLRPLSCVTGTPLWLVRPVKVSTSSKLYPDTRLLFFFFLFECSGIQFFSSLTCDLRDTMPRQRSLTLLPREAEDFPRGDRHFKHVPPLTYLIYLSPKLYK